ncbi:MAG: glutathionylspermidine synthase family protein [Campylobacterota bacterium]|nr:glutathionylspermidine synthase family protein [Campylobacterota bacterium]
MVTLHSVTPLNQEQLQAAGYSWHTSENGSAFVTDQIVNVTATEAEAYYHAANELYDMYVEAADHVIENNLFFELGIPVSLIETIKKSWDNDVHWHIYGRFDFAGGIAGKPIKLLGFNADTPTDLFETAIVQWELLRHNNIDEDQQFNAIYDALTNNLRRLITLFDDPEQFESLYDGWKILFSSHEGSDEEETTAKFLHQIAQDAGFKAGFEFLQNVKFDEEGIFDTHDEQYEYWFKRYPWEEISTDEPELAVLLGSIMNNQNAIILNPAYTMLFESKGMMKILNDLYPDSPYLLETSLEPINGAQVERRMFSRNGANTRILSADGSETAATDGDYANYKPLYQEYVELPTDSDGNHYKAELFFAYEACGLGFRRGGKILDETSKFVGHMLT